MALPRRLPTTQVYSPESSGPTAPSSTRSELWEGEARTPRAVAGARLEARSWPRWYRAMVEAGWLSAVHSTMPTCPLRFSKKVLTDTSRGGSARGRWGWRWAMAWDPPPTLSQMLAKGCLTHPSSSLDQLQPIQPGAGRFTPSPALRFLHPSWSIPLARSTLTPNLTFEGHLQPLLDKTRTSFSPVPKGEEQGRERRKKRRKAPLP